MGGRLRTTPGCKIVFKGDREFCLNEAQAAIVSHMIETQERTSQTQFTNKELVNLSPTTAGTVRGAFRNGSGTVAAWGELVVCCKGKKGIYQLNLD